MMKAVITSGGLDSSSPAEGGGKTGEVGI